MAEITHSVEVVCASQAEVDAVLEQISEDVSHAENVTTEGLTISFQMTATQDFPAG